ncbi:hypothetical protein Tco_0386894, partial [Tanacetum coccineum]
EKKIRPARSWTVTQANLQLPHLWILNCIKRSSKQLVAQHLLGSPLKKEPTLSSVVVHGTKTTQDPAFMDDEDDPYRLKRRASVRTCLKEMKTLMLNLKALQFLLPLLHQFKSKNYRLKFSCSNLIIKSWNKTKKRLLLKLLPLKLIQSHIQTLEALSGLLKKVTDTLNRFASILNAHNKGVPSVGKSTASPVEGEKNIIPVIEDAELANLVDLICIDVVEEYHKNKLLYNKYCDKMLKIKKSPKIKNCEVLINKGPITLKIYREDRSEEVILNLKVNDLHVAEWREVIQACPDKSEKGWKTIYALVKTRLD